MGTVMGGPASARPGGQMRQMRACRPRVGGKFAGIALALAPLALAFFAGRSSVSVPAPVASSLHRPRPRRATPPSDVSSALAVAGHEDVDKRPSGGSAEETREMDHGNRVLSVESRGW